MSKNITVGKTATVIRNTANPNIGKGDRGVIVGFEGKSVKMLICGNVWIVPVWAVRSI